MSHDCCVALLYDAMCLSACVRQGRSGHHDVNMALRDLDVNWTPTSYDSAIYLQKCYIYSPV